MNKKFIFQIFIALLILGIIGAGIGYYMYTKPVKTASELSADFTLESSALLKEFKDNGKGADEKYRAKNLQLNGVVSSIEKGAQGSFSVFFKDGDYLISCSFSGNDSKESTEIKEGATITIKGLYKGYSTDDLIGGTQIDLITCTLIK